jgi:hypothetical protein
MKIIIIKFELYLKILFNIKIILNKNMFISELGDKINELLSTHVEFTDDKIKNLINKNILEIAG